MSDTSKGHLAMLEAKTGKPTATPQSWNVCKNGMPRKCHGVRVCELHG